MIKEIKNIFIVGFSLTLFAVANVLNYYMLEGMLRVIVFIFISGISITLLIAYITYLNFKKKKFLTKIYDALENWFMFVGFLYYIFFLTMVLAYTGVGV